MKRGYEKAELTTATEVLKQLRWYPTDIEPRGGYFTSAANPILNAMVAPVMENAAKPVQNFEPDVFQQREV